MNPSPGITPFDVAGKTALVTGGSRGIGRSIAEKLAAAGARVAITYRSSTEEAEALCARLVQRGSECLLFQGDAAEAASAKEAVQGMLHAWGHVDILVNNAGITRDGLMLRLKESDWDAVIDTNLKSVFHFCKAVFRPMMKQRSGRIVTMSSVVGIIGNPGQTNYTASKAGVIGFSKSLARELGPRGVTVNVVAPGYVETDMTAALSEAARSALLDRVALKRTASPEDVANAVLFLVSPAARYVTGHVLHVDGGLAM